MFGVVALFLIFSSPISTSVVKDIIDSCSVDEFQCSNGDCISYDLVCNGFSECADGSDEARCGLGQYGLESEKPVLHRLKRQSNNYCRRTQFACRDGTCISFDGKCDGVVDCPDGSDETHALCRNNQCQYNWFRCTYGACVDGTAPCNGIKECADNSDELLPRCRNESEVVHKQFKCQDGSSIPASSHCDGVKDCPDGSDETVRACAAKTCSQHLFQCAYGACVDGGSDCNKVEDCADGSDEAVELCNKSGGGTGSTGTPPPTRPQAGLCVLPAYPSHGTYTTNIPNAKPSQAFEAVDITVTCNTGYGVIGSNTVSCRNGWWPESIPKCVVMCMLNPHPSVEYNCLETGKITGSRICNLYEPSGTVVNPKCSSTSYYSPSSLTFMNCVNGMWDYVARCYPGLPKIGTNVTILIKDRVEIHISDFIYSVPINYSKPTFHIDSNDLNTGADEERPTNKSDINISVDDNKLNVIHNSIHYNTETNELNVSGSADVSSNDSTELFTAEFNKTVNDIWNGIYKPFVPSKDILSVTPSVDDTHTTSPKPLDNNETNNESSNDNTPISGSNSNIEENDWRFGTSVPNTNEENREPQNTQNNNKVNINFNINNSSVYITAKDKVLTMT